MIDVEFFQKQIPHLFGQDIDLAQHPLDGNRMIEANPALVSNKKCGPEEEGHIEDGGHDLDPAIAKG